MATRRHLSLLPLAACSAISLTLAAQSTGVTTGDLKGLVRDTGGRALTQAKVTLSDEATGLSRSVNVDGNGAFAFRLLTPGSYTLTVEAPGFSTKKISSVGVRLASTQDVNVGMQALEASATVEVVGQTSIVDPTRTQVSNTIDTNEITNLPINRRDFTSFSLTTPLVAQDANTTSTGGAASGSGLSFLGQNSRSNNIMVDGLDNNDISVGSTRTTFSQDAIQEFVVVADGYSAEYGRAAGGVLNIITKSGGNDFTGDTFFFYRSGKWDAKRPHPGSPAVDSPFTQRQFGATVSGPLIKDKLFYLVSVERYNTDDSTNTAFTPAFASAVQSASGYTLHPGIQVWNENYTTGLVKLDWYASAASHWTFRYNAAKEINGSQLPWGGGSGPLGILDVTAGGTRDITDQSWSLANLWTPGGSFVNDFRILGSKRDHNLQSLDPNLGPSITLAGQATFGTQRFLPQVRTEKDYELFDAATWFTSKHTFKLGVDLMRTNLSGSLPLQFAGVYRFQAFSFPGPPPVTYTSGLQALGGGNPYGGQGLPVAFIQGFGKDSLDLTASYYSAFVQDTWQITDRFSLNLGLRYDKESLPAFHDVSDYAALAAGGPSQLASWSIYTLPGSTGGTVVPGGPYTNSVFQHSNDWSSSRVSPRLSFNWQATDTTRFYGGYGTFSGRTQLGPFGAVYLNNGTDMQTIVQILGADPTNPLAPWKTWANAAGNTNRRYQSYPGGIKSLLLPGHSEMPETQQSNLGMEIAPLATLKFTFDLVYAKGKHFLTVHDVNALIPNPAFGVIPGAPPTRRPDSRYSSVIRYDDSGESRYRAATFGMQWQLRDTVALNFSYTYSKSEDNYTDWVTDVEPMNTFDPKVDMGPSNQDQRNRFLISGVFSSKNWQNAFFRNWTASFIGRFASGRPYTILTGVDNDYGTLGGQNFGNGDGGAPAADRPMGVGRNSQTLPFGSNMDIRLARKFPIGKKGGFEMMVDVFNVFNHYNPTAIQSIQAAPNYGQPVLTTLDHNRQVQLGVRFSW